MDTPKRWRKAPQEALGKRFTEARPAEVEPPNPPIGLRVLIVDDDRGVRDVTVRLLEFEGLRATSVASGQEALELLDAQTFDCILLDLTMPRFSGADTFRALRKQNQALPVVFSSGQRDIAVEALAGEDEHAYFLDKPYSPARLLDAIVRACKR